MDLHDHAVEWCADHALCVHSDSDTPRQQQVHTSAALNLRELNARRSRIFQLQRDEALYMRFFFTVLVRCVRSLWRPAAGIEYARNDKACAARQQNSGENAQMGALDGHETSP